MRIERFRRYMNHYCSPEQAAAVGWEVLGMRAFLMTVASASSDVEMLLKSGEGGAKRLLQVSDEKWAEVKDKVLDGWMLQRDGGGLHCYIPQDGGLYKKEKQAASSSTGKHGERGLWEPSAEDRLQGMVDGKPFEPAKPPKKAAKGQDLPEASETVKTLFERFWVAYPRKIKKTEAFQSFVRIAPDEALFERIISDVSLRSYTRSWNTNFGQYIPHATTYLNNAVWDQGVVLTNHELMASTLSTKERFEFHSKNPQETQSWVTSQSVAGKIPTQEDVCHRLGVKSFSEQTLAFVGDVEVLSADASPAHKPEPVMDSFRTELLEAISDLPHQKQAKILEKTVIEQREWLRLWRTANQAKREAAPSKSGRLTHSETQESRARDDGSDGVIDVSCRVVEPAPAASQVSGQQEDWF